MNAKLINVLRKNKIYNEAFSKFRLSMIKIYYLFMTLLVGALAFVFTSATPFSKKVSLVKNKPFVVVLDAGHGGHDSGNRGNGYFEKDIALEIILKTGAILEKDPSIKVIYTRKTDKFVDLFVRGDIANKAKADLFVSIHCNAHNSNAYGTETFVLGLHANERNFKIAKKENSVILLEDDYQKNYDGFDPNSPESVIGLTLMQEEYLDQSLVLAGEIQNSFTKKLKRNNRGVKQAGFIVLHRTFMPSVLVEVGFLTNKNEGKYLNSKKGKLEMANSISKAIKNYQKTVVDSYSLNTLEDKKSKVDSQEKTIDTTEKVTKTIKEDIPKTNGQIESIKDSVVKKNDSIIEYRVQLAAGSSKIETTPTNFKGLTEVYYKENDGVFKYYYGAKNSYTEIKKVKQLAVEKGFSSCFIVAFKNKKKISLSEAIDF